MFLTPTAELDTLERMSELYNLSNGFVRRKIKQENDFVLRRARRFSQCSFMYDVIDLEPDSHIGALEAREIR
jgi:hypothetical protein